MMTSRTQTILEYWLGPEAQRDAPEAPVQERWWAKSEEMDAQIQKEFGADVERAGAGHLDDWLSEPRGALAVVILLDQFTRNIHRDHGDMYAHDDRALAITNAAVAAKQDADLRAAERQFLYMPLMHSEQLADQDEALRLFEGLAADAPNFAGTVKFCHAHRDIVKRFGRFPHRNALLGRDSTPEELEFLTQPGSSF